MGPQVNLVLWILFYTIMPYMRFTLYSGVQKTYIYIYIYNIYIYIYIYYIYIYAYFIKDYIQGFGVEIFIGLTQDQIPVFHL